MQDSQDIRRVFAEGPGAALLRPPGPEHAWIATARTEDWMPWRGQAGDLLSKAEYARVSARRRVEDRLTLVLCYALHRLLLGAWLQVDPADVPLARDQDGRPVLEDGSLYTSLSHTDGACAFALGTAGPVGVDIESLARLDALDEIGDRIVHPTEVAALAGLDDDERRRALLQLWVRKEACLKATGTGLATEMDTFAAAAGARLRLPMHGSAEQMDLRVEDMRLHSPHLAAWAAPAHMHGLEHLLVPG